MTLTNRIGRIAGALLSLLSVALLVLLEEDGIWLVCLMLSFSLILLGLRRILFYFTMARHMVNGRGVLYIGVILMDFGIFTLSISRNESAFLIFYLLGIHAFGGVMSVMRAREARCFKAPSWRVSLAQGVVNLGVAAAAVYFGFIRADMRALTLLYAAVLFYSALARLVSAFRRTAIVYIQ